MSVTFESEAEARERLERRFQGRVRASRIPDPLRALSFDEMDRGGTRALAVHAAERFAQDGSPLLLHGTVGSGKTRLAATAAWAYLDRERIRWFAVSELVMRLMAFDTPEMRGEAVQALTEDVALVLDDLDKVKPSEFVVGALFQAIDMRYAKGLPLLVTTNKSPDGLAAMLGEPIADRLMGYCDVHELSGESRRLA